MVVPKEGLYIMSKPTIEQLAIENADLKKEIDALIGQLKTKDKHFKEEHKRHCLLYTSDAADE